MLLATGGGLASLTFSRLWVTPTFIPKGYYRVEVMRRVSVNSEEGGTLRISVNEREPRPLTLAVGGMKDSIAPTHPGMKSYCTIQLKPVSEGGKEFTKLVMESDQTKLTGAWPDNGLGSVRWIHMNVGPMRQPFRWAARSGDYRQGTPVLLGTAGGKPVTLVVGGTRR